ncbi:phage terminase large subunit family protein [Diaphorobacter aerolatus]|uniref:phage terminase large subunit family protein n=1 Tax=Diaphorobacter aerolatus TaxID=1288495 RepID=UPI001D01AE9B|nr:phage terminase large subunit family protein [Diaphorobacter aerolatus]
MKTSMETNAFVGYSDTLSVRAGERIRFHLASDTHEQVDVKFVRVRCADADATGPGIKYRELVSPVDGAHRVEPRIAPCGSFMSVPSDPRLAPAGAFSFGCYIWPTRLLNTPQTVMARWCEDSATGYALQVTRGGVVLRVGAGAGAIELTTGVPLEQRRWYWVQGGLDPATGEMVVHQCRLADGVLPEDRHEARALRPGTWRIDSQGPLTIAAHALSVSSAYCTAHYDGKVEAPRMAAGLLNAEALRRGDDAARSGVADAALIASWDFTHGIDTLDVLDRSPIFCMACCINCLVAA